MSNTIAEAQDFGSRFFASGQGAASLTAGGSGDNTEVVGEWVDLLGIPADDDTQLGVQGVRFYSCGIVIQGQGTVADGETLVLKTVKLETCPPTSAGAPDTGSVTEFITDEASVATTTVLAPSGAAFTNKRFSYQNARYLMAADRFVRLKFTPDLSAANTDTALVNGALILGGGHVPADQAKA